MIYCINPKCQKRQNPDGLEICQACGSSLVINERYLLVKPLRKLDERYHTEIFEVDNWGTPKVLKVLTSNSRKLIRLFQQEAEVLQRLEHLGLPKVDTYFVFSPSNGPKELHCLVMEKIFGHNLRQWLEEKGPISEVLAIDWLQQLVNILAQLHREQFLHRDIKPSNIMRRQNGQLVLIDFGTVREVTSTYIKKLAGCEVTRVYSSGYTALEQVNGQAVPESEFFALGRTFVHLLTGTYPDDLPKDSQSNQLIWRDSAPQISPFFADLLDQLMAPMPQQRLHNPLVILDRLAKLSRPARVVPADDCATALPPEAEADLLGTSIDNRYQILRVLGQGSFGRTYLAADEQRFGEHCVLKEIIPSGRVEQTVQKLRSLFETEAKVLYQLNHPQIPKFMACFAKLGRLFIVQEYIDGKTYATLLRERQQQGQCFGEAEVIQWLRDLLPVLTYLHERHLVHRDISPDNVMLPNSSQSRPVLIDFGLVKQTVRQIWAVKPDSSNSTGQSFGGRFGYIPPEQIRIGQCYPCSDIYALGVTAIVLLTGKEPNMLVERETLEWQWHSYVEISDQLGTILKKMLAEKPKERYQSAQEVLIDLQVLTSQRAIAIPAPSRKLTWERSNHAEQKEQIAEIAKINSYQQLCRQAEEHTNIGETSAERLEAEVPEATPLYEATKSKFSGAVNSESQQQAAMPPQLQPAFLAHCRQELARCLGPIAKYILEETLAQHPDISPPQLVEALAGEIPNFQQAAEFRNRLKLNPEIPSKPVTAPPKTQPEAVTPPQLHPAFLARCRQELARCLGPIAKHILEETLAQHPDISPSQLVEALAAEIPNSQQAAEFKQCLLL